MFIHEISWQQFTKLNNIKNLSLNEQVHSYNKYLAELSLQRRLAAMGGNRVTEATTTLPPPLIMNFESFFPVANPELVGSWNTYFGYASGDVCNFKQVNISGTEVRLYDSPTFTLASSTMLDTSLTSFDDQGGYITSIVGNYFFSQNASLNYVNLSACTAITGDVGFPSLFTFLQSSTSVNSITLKFPVCTNFGGSTGNNGIFASGFTGKNVSLTVKSSLMTSNGGNPDGDIQFLQANNNVTVITV